MLADPLPSIALVARAVVICEGSLLLLHNTRYTPEGYFVLPGGHVDPGERVAQALVRELEEELNWKLTQEPPFLGAFEQRYRRPEGHWVQELCFVFRVLVSKAPELRNNEPHLAFTWCPLSQLTQQALKPAFLRDYLQDWLTGPDHQAAFRTPAPQVLGGG